MLLIISRLKTEGYRSVSGVEDKHAEPMLPYATSTAKGNVN